MPTIRAPGQAYRDLLEQGRILTVACGAGSSALVILTGPGGTSRKVALGAGEVQSFGPFQTDNAVAVEVPAGVAEVTESIAEDAALARTITVNGATYFVTASGNKSSLTPMYNLPAPASMSGVTEVIVAQFAIPVAAGASFLAVLGRLEMMLSASKSGPSETATFKVRVGTTGTLSDTTVYSSASLLSGTNISVGTPLHFKRVSETALQKLGAGLSTGAFTAPSTVAYPAAVTVGDMDDATYYVSITAASSSTAETITLQDLIARLVAP